MFKKIIVISLLAVGIILTGCSQKNELSKNAIFEKKQECLTYKYILENEINSDINISIDKIEEIFYSEKNNTCYWSISSLNVKNNIKTYWILDLLSNKYIESTEWNERIMLYENTYKQKIKELK